ncbi:MAG: hypothetical protein HY330_07180 [Chloroflexi bacterium]|nr:hypothetical protein [Chloroflexota bacterium]
MAVRAGQLAYEVIQGWDRLPEGWSYVEVGGVATDSRDRVYVFNRGQHPVIVFDRDGRFLTAWGEGVFTNPHGITIGPDDAVYCVDNFDHTVRKFTTEGVPLLTLGTKDRPSDTGYTRESPKVLRAAGPFNRPTNLALSPAGEMYVADGYGNARVHKFSAAGKHLFSWGEPGSGPGQLNLPHGIVIDRRGTVYVADRENSRIQLFTPDGEYLAEWRDVNRPCDLYIDRDEHMYVAELGFRAGIAAGAPVPEGHTPLARVSVFTLDGRLRARWGGAESCAPGNFFAPHGIWADSHGDIYVGEVIASAGGRRGLVPLDCHALQKFARKR